MIKSITPDSLSHKFLRLLFSRRELAKGITVCDIPFRLLYTIMEGFAICTVAAGALLILFSILLALLAPFFQYNFVLATLANVGFCTSVLTLILLFLLAITSARAGWIPILPTWLTNKHQDKEPSLLTVWWRSFKDKTCVKIVIGDTDK